MRFVCVVGKLPGNSDNLVPGAEGARVVVTDFGVARGIEQDAFAAQVTMTDAAVGTPAYMAPEQIEGGTLTAAIDQYALGVVLFEMVTGELPFAGDTPLATAVKRLTQAPPSPDELAPGLDALWVGVIRRCLARYPQDRFPSVSEVGRATLGCIFWWSRSLPPRRGWQNSAPPGFISKPGC